MRTDEAALLAQWALELTTAVKDVLGQQNHYMTCAQATANKLVQVVEARRKFEAQEAAEQKEFHANLEAMAKVRRLT
jgi:hypothetical protein